MPAANVPLARITRVSIYVHVQAPPAFVWSPVMPEVLNTDTIVLIEDQDGHIGASSVCTFTEYGADLSVAHAMRPLAMGILRKGQATINDHWAWMAQRRPGVSNTAIAGLDIALWDLLAKRQNVPLYALLGGARDSIECYASMPVLPEPDD